MMKEHFLNYDQSLEVKELGFDEVCFAYFNDGKHICYTSIIKQNTNTFWHNKAITSPLKSQFFKWARDKKLSDSCVCRYQSRDDGGVYYYYVINHDFGVEETKHFKEGFYSYEEAEDACIYKIIELIKERI